MLNRNINWVILPRKYEKKPIKFENIHGEENTKHIPTSLKLVCVEI